MLVMEYSRAGNLTLTNGVKVSHVAAYLGVILGVLSIVWLNFRCSTWVTKFVGAITAINALILLSMAAWGMYLAGAVAKIKKAHGMNLKVKTGWQEDVTLFVQEHGQGIGMIALAIVVMAVIILFFRSPGARKLGGVILLIAVIGLVLFGGIGYIIRESKAPEPNEIGKWVTAKPNQVTLITVNSQTFTAIEYPSGWDWDISLFNPKGENLEWPSSLVCMKGNQRIEFDRAADPRLPGLPEGKDPVLVKILLPTGMEKMEYQLAVVARKVKTVRK